MAELKTRKGNIIPCNILNESYDSYIIELNGKIGPVKKERIVSVNAIDEAVLDRIRTGAKRIFDKIKAAVYNFFVKDNRIRVFNEDGDIIPVSVPLNWALVAQNNDNMTYFPNDDDIRLADELGLNIKFDARVPSDNGTIGSYEDYKKELMNESVNESAKTYAMGNGWEDSGLPYVYPYATGDDKPKKGNVTNDYKYIPDMEYDDVVENIIDKYMGLRVGDREHDVLCLWGPPGIGKTAMIQEVKERLKKEGYNIRVCSISGNSRPDMSLYMQGKKDMAYTGHSGKEYTKSVWVSNEMFGIPAYANAGLTDEERRDADIYANGGRYEKMENGEIKCISRPDGGIFFIDEFSRSNAVMLNEFMQMFADAKFGSNLVVGSRWLLVLAANRKQDMTNIETADTFKLDSAQASRIESVNVVINPDTWLKWASREETDVSKRDVNADYYTDKDDANLPTRTKILPEIIDYIKGAKGELYNVQISDDTMPEFVNQHMTKATPRNWENASIDLRKLMSRASVMTHKPINNIIDLIDSGYRGIDSLDPIIDMVARHVGVPAAEKFRIFLQNYVFNIQEVENIWLNGKTQLKATPSVTLKEFIIPRLVEANPNAVNADSKTFDQVVPAKGLLNVINFLYLMSTRATGLKSAKESGIMMFNKAWGWFQDECVKKYSCMNDLGFEDNIKRLPEDKKEEYREAILKKEELNDKNVNKI